MILPIVAYGDPVLREVCSPIDKNYPYLKELITNMYDTMYDSNGVGLAAPQIGKSIRLFVVDGTPFSSDKDLSESERSFLKSFKRTFINAELLEETGEKWSFNEGCLSIPGINEDIVRFGTIKLQYMDESFELKQEVFSGLAARIIQHEYDHTQGILFTDKLSSFKKRIIEGRLKNISRGKVSVGYKMSFYQHKQK